MILKNCKRCNVQPTVNKRARLYGQPHTRVSCPKCGFTIWTRNGGTKDPETVWNDCNKRVVYQPWNTFRIVTHKNSVPKGYCNDECTFTKSGGAKAFDDLNYDE